MPHSRQGAPRLPCRGCSPGERLAFLHVHEVRRRGPQGAVGKQPDRQPLDDWLGDISDEDWSEGAAELAEQRRAATVRPEPQRDTERDGVAVSTAQVAALPRPAAGPSSGGGPSPHSLSWS